MTVYANNLLKMVNDFREGPVISLKSEPSKPYDVALLEEIRELLKYNIKD